MEPHPTRASLYLRRGRAIKHLPLMIVLLRKVLI
jgi:hypothetical protein